MWSMTHLREKEFWLEWLHMYKSYKCLWDVGTKEYSSRPQKKAAYADLAYLARTIHPDADENWVRCRINSFRTSYRRELKRVIEARQKGETHEPTLFYFSLLNEFLGNAAEGGDATICNPRTAKKKVANDADEISNAASEEGEEDPFTVVEENVYTVKREQPGIKIRKVDKNQTGSMETYSESFERSLQQRNHPSPKSFQPAVEDECELFGNRLASHFRNMDPNQRLIAEKIISDVCIYARLGQLTMQSGLVVEMANE